MFARKPRHYLNRHRHIIPGVIAFLLAGVAGLWSWNTLAELFSWPQAQYRHALAALLILLVAGRILSPARRSAAGFTEVRNESQAH